jgi:hypothetical protein
MKISVCRCNTPITWAKNTKGHFIAFELKEVEDGNRFVLSNDATPIAYSTVIGRGHRKHVCVEVETVEQGRLDL